MTHIFKLSESVSLAFHAASLLARQPARRVRVSEMAPLFGASEHTLAKVMQALTRARLTESVPGPSGGFRLTRDAAAISLIQIYEAIEGPLQPEHCPLGEPASKARVCVLDDLMQRLNDEVHAHFTNTTLASLAADIELGDLATAAASITTAHHRDGRR